MRNNLLSIITINYNNAENLKRTIESVLNQTFKTFEYILIDGGSTDASVDIIKKIKDRIDYWISEKDAGIFNAMNKALAVATGQYVMFVNSGDDLMNENILLEMVPQLKGEDIIYGNYLVKNNTQTFLKQYPDKLQFSHFLHDSLPHSAGAFIKRAAFRDELSGYDESLKVVSDWSWYVSAIFKYNCSYKHIDVVIGVFDHTGNSATNPEITSKEKKEFFEREFPLIYEEISELLQYKTKYYTLAGSRFFKGYFTLKKIFG